MLSMRGFPLHAHISLPFFFPLYYSAGFRALHHKQNLRIPLHTRCSFICRQPPYIVIGWQLVSYRRSFFLKVPNGGYQALNSSPLPLGEGPLEPQDKRVQCKMIPGDDRYFLMYFIMGTYFGPDLKGERTQKSVLQRLAEGLPPYTSEQLVGSHIRTSEIEQIYYFLTRKAEKSFVVKVPILHQFIEGDYPFLVEEVTGSYPHFPALFPPHLHPLTESLNRSKIIGNIVFIRNPAIFYIKGEDVERFKRLTGLQDLFVESSTIQLPNHAFQREELDDEDADDVPILKYYRGCQRKRRLNDILGAGKPPKPPQAQEKTGGLPKSYEFTWKSSARQLRSEVRDGPGMVILPSRPRREELNHIVGVARNAYAVTGSAALGLVGPAIGLMDIGESENSYLFRVALPGVKRENRAFQCLVESDGKVLIKGETVTGEKRVYRFSQAFVMQTQNLCPSGPFSVLFHLPGPVDPQQFCGSFGADGILEGVVMKPKPSKLT